MDEAALIKKMATIEVLCAGLPIEEDHANTKARECIIARLKTANEKEPTAEFQFSLNDEWQRRLFGALARRYGLEPFRYRGQQHTTVMLTAPERFVEETLWPQYQELAAALRGWMEEVTERIIGTALQSDGSSVVERVGVQSLSSNATGPAA